MEILDNKHNIRISGREDLFSAGLTYIESCKYGFAYHCFSKIENPDVAVLYNMAYCCYCISWYEQAYALLKDAERQLSGFGNVSILQLPIEFQRWEQCVNDSLGPMPVKTFPWMSVIQLFHLKAAVASKLQLHTEVRSIASLFGGKFNYINKLIKK